MTNSKSTKRALLSSALAVFMCVAMLIGTTFAWFTDTAKTNVNRIQAGTLKVDIIGATNNDSITGIGLKFENADGSTNILWEPGATFKTQGFRIANKGNLALKYTLVLNGVNGDSELLDVIDFSVVKADGTTVPLNTFEGHLTANTVSNDVLYIQGHMSEDAGNKYQAKELNGLGITVYATQDTVESDSNDNLYDENATYGSVVTANDLLNAVANAENGDIIVLENDITLDKIVTVENKRITLDLNGHTITTDKTADEFGWDDGNWSIVSVRGGELTVMGNGNLLGVTGVTYGADVQNGGKLIIENGTVFGSLTAVYVEKGTVEINGGTFGVTNPESTYGSRFVLNCKDDNYNNGTANFVVNGGVFVGFNPANNAAEGASTNFVSSGNTSVALNGNYYVVPNGAALVGNATQLATAITNGGSVVLTSDITSANILSINNNVEIYGNGNTITVGAGNDRVFDVQGTDSDISIKLCNLLIKNDNNIAYDRAISFYDNEGKIRVEMDNCTLQTQHYAVNIAKDNDDIEITVKNSKLTGYCAAQTWSPNSKLTFENCTLTGVNKWNGTDNDFSTVNVVSYATNATVALNNCVIKNEASGTAVQRFIGIETNAAVTATGCNFYNNGAQVTADAVRENADGKYCYIGTGGTYTLTIN